jgi:hypothetical protein
MLLSGRCDATPSLTVSNDGGPFLLMPKRRQQGNGQLLSIADFA